MVQLSYQKNETKKTTHQMGIGEMSEHPLAPNNVIGTWRKLKVLQACAVERAHALIAAQIFPRFLQEMLILLHQVHRLEVPGQQMLSYPSNTYKC
jgi:hypothetical protein